MTLQTSDGRQNEKPNYSAGGGDSEATKYQFDDQKKKQTPRIAGGNKGHFREMFRIKKGGGGDAVEGKKSKPS